MKFLQIFVLVLVLTLTANAQNTWVKGKVYNQMGLPLADVAVTITDKSGRKITTYTKENGSYQFQIVGGIYKIKAAFRKKEPYKNFEIKKISIPFGVEFIFDITLTVTEKFKNEFSDLS
jgi:hypothetical protein